MKVNLENLRRQTNESEMVMIVVVVKERVVKVRRKDGEDCDAVWW